MPPQAKADLRAELLAARRAVPSSVRTAEAAALTAGLFEFVSARLAAQATVCAYVPVGSEPGSVHLLDALVSAGVRVLLPISGDGPPAALRWAPYVPGELAPARFGLLEPTSPTLDPQAIAEAAVVLVPALAVDGQGARLGRGAGFYDRSLPLRNPAAALVAVIRDNELLPALPAEPHDVPMTHVATPGGGVQELRAGDTT